ncbi:MAG: hypothetical protein OXF49_02220 [Candidatus Saccharibacteria bacterium]|nr:hypothetical protein [Candidatus Saccharibacteria bacterium]MCY4088921.1 hypothetical protein [Candidatus Saccharibacteria bacterium]
MTKKKEPLKLVSQVDGKPFISIEIDLENNIAILKAPQTDDTTLYEVEDLELFISKLPSELTAIKKILDVYKAEWLKAL